MSIKRFFARTTTEAFRKVRDALGPEAVILSNRMVDGGIEILASRHDHISSLLPDWAAEPEEGARFRTAEPSPLPALSPFAAFQRAPGPPGKKTESRQSEVRHAGSATPFSNWTDTLKRVKIEQENDRDRLNVLSVGHAKKAESARSPIVAVERPGIQLDDARAKYHAEPAGGKWLAKRDVIRKTRELPAAQEVSGSPEGNNGVKKRESSSKESPAKTVRKVISAGSSKTEPPSLFDPARLAEEVAASVVREIRSMRSDLEHPFTSWNWMGQGAADSLRDGLLSRLVDSGFSIRFAHNLLRRVSDASAVQNNEKQALAYLRQFLSNNLEAIGNEEEILEKGGVYALVGPTGVGKTTTTAKLAARCIIRHGVEKLALLTTDGYRIGGHEQLRIYGKILGVDVHPVRDAQNLAATLVELRGKHMVLIDTVGMSQRDQMVAEQVAMFTRCGAHIKRLLLLNASSSLQTLNEVAEAYRGGGLAGAIITKVDEAVASGCALEVAIRHCLPLYYVSNGQRVPEDLELADPVQLVNTALDSSGFTDPILPGLFRDMLAGASAGTHRNRAGAALD